MKEEILENTQCDACGQWEFECRDGIYYCVTCQMPAKAMEKHPPEKKDVEGEGEAGNE